MSVLKKRKLNSSHNKNDGVEGIEHQSSKLNEAISPSEDDAPATTSPEPAPAPAKTFRDLGLIGMVSFA